jgi:RimJ/RimL family protein N-acetyltransferase
VGVAGSPRVIVRPLCRGDAESVRQVFEGLGPGSRRARFGVSKTRLSERELDALTDVDHDSHEALVAVEAESGRAVGIVRFVRDAEDGRTAEVAFAVVDAWQARGLGTRLAELLACRARTVGIERLRATILPDNLSSRSLLRRLGRTVGSRFDGGWLELVVALD